MAGNKTFNKFISNILDAVTEKIPEITDNGLNEDSLEKVENTIKEEVVQPKENFIEKETKKFFSKPTVSSTVETTTSSDDVVDNDNLTSLLKSTPNTTQVESSTEQNTTVESVQETKEVEIETFPVYQESITVNQADMSKEELFMHYMDVRDELLVGFADTCYDTIEGIQSNSVILKERKLEKIQSIEDEFLMISNDDFDSIVVFFKKMKHELHMLQNNLGEYDERVYDNNLIEDSRIKNYDIIGLFASNELYHYLLEDDKEAVNQLITIRETIYKKAKTCGKFDNYIVESENIILSCHTIIDLINAKNKLDDLLIDLNIKINTSSESSTLFG